jgi:hypothetical protein
VLKIRAIIRSVFGSPAEEVKKVETIETAEAQAVEASPELRAAIQTVQTAIVAHREAVCELQQAKAGVAEIDEEIGLLRQRVADRDRELAAKGVRGAYVGEQSLDEISLEDAQRGRRVAESRIGLCQERAEATKNALAAANQAVEAARVAFLKAGYLVAFSAYLDEARKLRQLYFDLSAWRQALGPAATGLPESYGLIIGAEDPDRPRWAILDERFGIHNVAGALMERLQSLDAELGDLRREVKRILTGPDGRSANER